MNARRGLIRLWVIASAVWMVSGSPFAAAGDVRPPPGFSSSPWIGSEARFHRWSGSRAPSPEGRAETREDRPSLFNRAMGALIPSAEAAEPNALREPPDDDGPWLDYRTGTRLPKCPDDITVVRNNCLGTFVSSGGAKYVGEFRDDKFNGKGTLYAPNGSVRYVGEFQDGKFNGQGTFTYANGKYVGQFQMTSSAARGP